MTTYDILFDPEYLNIPFKVGDNWVKDLSEGDINTPLHSTCMNAIKITLPITCRTNEDFYNLYPEYLI